VVGGVLIFAADADGLKQRVGDKPSIAALPFINMSGDPEQGTVRC